MRSLKILDLKSKNYFFFLEEDFFVDFLAAFLAGFFFVAIVTTFVS